MAREPKPASGIHPDDAPEYQEFLDNVAVQLSGWANQNADGRENAREFAARVLGQTRDFVRRTGRY